MCRLSTAKSVYNKGLIFSTKDRRDANLFVFSILDIKSGYHQVEIEKEHTERTAFSVGPLGFFEFKRIPFGLSNSPATYQCLMNDCFEYLYLKACLIYIDDNIVFADTYEEHLRRLTQFLQRVRGSGMKLAPNKCTLFKDRIKFLGHIVSADRIESDPSNVLYNNILSIFYLRLCGVRHMVKDHADSERGKPL